MAIPFRLTLVVSFLTALLVPLRASAQQPSGSSGVPSPSASAERDAPPPIHWTVGPSKVVLGHDLTMDLPDGNAYAGVADAKKLLERNGNFQNDNLLGVVVGTDDEAEWMVTLRYEDDGYVKDDEKLDAEAILQSLREGTEEANQERVARGFLPLAVDGWREPPRYDRASHHVVWGVDVSTKDGVSVNYSTRILGRHGWVALNLLTGPEHLEADKPAVAKLLDVTGFDKGSRYEDFAKGDKLAEYGLVGLVLGGAGVVALKAAKVGVIASFWKVILAGLIAAKKAVIVGLAACGAFLKRLFGRKRREGTDVSTSA